MLSAVRACHRKREARTCAAVGDRTRTGERRDLWRGLLPLLVALGPIDQAVRRGSGRAGSPWAARGAMSRSLGLISETNARMRSKWVVHIVVVIPPSTGGATAGGAS